MAKDIENKPLTAVTGVTFLLYKDQEGGAPLWMETQNVQPDSGGRYSVQLGATKPDGLPTDIFISAEARWLAVQISGQSEQPRVLLLSVPYALKAADTETFGGLPPSAFMRVNPSTSSPGDTGGAPGGNGNATSGVPAGALNQEGKPGPQTKTLDYVAKFTTAKGVLGNSLIFDNGTNVGVSTSTPKFPLDVNGIVNAASYNLAGQAFASGSYANTSAYLGFSGNSTITGNNNTGAGIGTLFLTTTGSQDTAIGAYSLYHNTTGNANTATGWLTLNENVTGIQNTAAGVQALEYNVSGSNDTANGVFSLYANTTGGANTAIGSSSLSQNIGGSYNTATGNNALGSNTAGGSNTAVGNVALYYNVAGSSNTALGASAGPSSTSTNLSNSTAIGANAVVSESNALVLGCEAGVNSCPAGVYVGISTGIPSGPLHVNGPYGAPPSSLPSGNNGLLIGTAGDGSYKWLQSYAGSLILNAVGQNVGIGTTAPDTLLSVNGGADKPGGGSWATFSDQRLKDVNGGFSQGLEQVLKINPVRYRYKDGNAMGIRDRDEHVGLVAQEVQRVIPEAVTENAKGYLLVNNDPIIWAMLNAIKEQQEEIKTLRAQLSTRAAKDAVLESRLASLEREHRTQGQLASASQMSPRLLSGDVRH